MHSLRQGLKGDADRGDVRSSRGGLRQRLQLTLTGGGHRLERSTRLFEAIVRQSIGRPQVVLERPLGYVVVVRRIVDNL